MPICFGVQWIKLHIDPWLHSLWCNTVQNRIYLERGMERVRQRDWRNGKKQIQKQSSSTVTAFVGTTIWLFCSVNLRAYLHHFKISMYVSSRHDFHLVQTPFWMFLTRNEKKTCAHTCTKKAAHDRKRQPVHNWEHWTKKIVHTCSDTHTVWVVQARILFHDQASIERFRLCRWCGSMTHSILTGTFLSNYNDKQKKETTAKSIYLNRRVI